ncbi:hypothetical protein SAMN06269185_1073 [Natronoarchaeum philippinense]|uniref:Uncharacterized protein n=1 Tax=Natronoarchaeum philippinense TaxID=558529 RepID=A0A285N9R6_NATPI|nr:hypothetical protein [Natronoarchaeum philippinense]SNZ06170.1 hypothetical protein SAMN06269185_1073 [Natronoarchaeum philippinense]
MAEENRNRRRIVVACLLVVVGVALGSAAVIEMYHVGSGVHYNASDGPEVVLGQDINATAQQPFPDDNTVDLSPHGTISSPGPTYVRVDEVGEWTRLSQLDVGDHAMTLDMDGKNEIVVEGAATGLEFRDVALDNGQSDLAVTTSAASTVTVRDLPSNEYVRVVNGSGGVHDVVWTDDNGSATLSFSSSTTVSFESTEVVVDQPQPEDGSVINQQGSTDLSVHVDHPTFDDGGSVNVTFRDPEGGIIGSEMLTSEGRASTTWSSIQTGTNRWYVRVTDDDGVQMTSDIYQFDVPGNLELRDEETQELINGTNASATIRFFDEGSEQVVTKTTTSGVVDLTDLPATTELVISMDVEGYYDRRLILRDITQQQTAYLLNESSEAVENDFTIDDRTGNFPVSESRLLIQKPIPVGNNTSEYQVIAGNDFGAAGRVSTTLASGDRYRILVEGRDGRIRSLGSYQAERAGLVELTIGTIEIEAPDNQGYVFTATTEETEDDSVTQVRVSYQDTAAQTSRLEYSIHVAGNESAVVHGPVEVFDPTTYSEVINLPSNKSYAVTWEAERSGQTIGGTKMVGGVGPLNLPLGATFLQVLGMSGLIMLAGLFGGALSRTGAIAIVAIAFVLTMLGITSIPYPFLFGAGVVAVMFKVGEGGVGL